MKLQNRFQTKNLTLNASYFQYIV